MTVRRVGLVGAGPHMVENLLPALRGLPDCTVTAIATAHADRARHFADRWGIPCHFGSWEDLLLEPLDLVVVASTPQMHVEVATACVGAGLPVFIEKPPAPDLASLLRLSALAADADASVAVGYNFRFATAVQQMLTVMESMGDLRHGRVAIRSRKPTEPMWGLSTTFESFLFSVGIHAIEMACAVFGEPSKVDSVRVRIGEERDHCTSLLRFPNGRSCELSMTNASNRFEFDVELVGTLGRVSCSNLSEVCWARHDGGVPAKSVQALSTSGLSGGYDRSGYSGVLARCLVGDGRGQRSDLVTSASVYRILEQLVR